MRTRLTHWHCCHGFQIAGFNQNRKRRSGFRFQCVSVVTCLPLFFITTNQIWRIPVTDELKRWTCCVYVDWSDKWCANRLHPADTLCYSEKVKEQGFCKEHFRHLKMQGVKACWENMSPHNNENYWLYPRNCSEMSDIPTGLVNGFLYKVSARYVWDMRLRRA